MLKTVLVHLALNPEQTEQLQSLQTLFTQAYLLAASIAAELGTMGRVRLHHESYSRIREKYPKLGAQMACNVIHAVSMLRLQTDSAGVEKIMSSKNKHGFDSNTPVLFDRNTLSIKGGVISIFTLEGRMKLALKKMQDLEYIFRTEKLKMAILKKNANSYKLKLIFTSDAGANITSPAPVYAKKLHSIETSNEA
jgi:hypothetical protein